MKALVKLERVTRRCLYCSTCYLMEMLVVSAGVRELNYIDALASKSQRGQCQVYRELFAWSSQAESSNRFWL